MEVKAMRDGNVAGRINLLGVRVAYAQGLNEPTAGPFDAGQAGTPKYSCKLLIPESAQAVLAEIQAVMWAQASAEWADRAQQVWQELSARDKLALGNGANKASQAGFLGNWFISCSAKAANPPKLLSQYVDGQGKVIELPRPQNVIYSGCYVNAQVDFWVQDNKYGKRINAEIKLVQFAGDGPAFGGGASADTSVFASAAQQAPAGFAGFAPAPAMPAAPMAAPVMAAPAAPAAPSGVTGYAPQMAAPSTGAPMMPPGFAPQAPAPFMPQQGPAVAAPWAPPGV